METFVCCFCLTSRNGFLLLSFIFLYSFLCYFLLFFLFQFFALFRFSSLSLIFLGCKYCNHKHGMTLVQGHLFSSRTLLRPISSVTTTSCSQGAINGAELYKELHQVCFKSTFHWQQIIREESIRFANAQLGSFLHVDHVKF